MSQLTIFDPWNQEMTRELDDGVLEVYCPEVERWVLACQCGPHIECPEHLLNCAMERSAS
jgi:hypothetical protein